MKLTLTLLTAFFVAPLAALHAGGGLPGVPRFGKPGCENLQPLENFGALASNHWN